MNRQPRHWKIRGYDSTTVIFERDVPIGCMTEDQLKATLRCLVAKAGLSFDEIVGANAKRRTKLSNPLLEVHRDGPRPNFTCGDNPFFTAIVYEGDKPAVFSLN